MNTFRSLLLGLFVLSLSGAAAAQATRTWVSGVGDDANPCSRTAPCKTFAGSISKTAVNGEINCLDPGGFGVVTITKSITIDCATTEGGILSAGSAGAVIINITDPSDTRKQVRLHGLDINGAGTGTDGVRVIAANGVELDHVSVENITGDALDVTGSVNVTVKNSNFRAAGNGVNVDVASGISAVLVSDTTISFCGNGILSQRNAIVGLRSDSIIFNSTGLAIANGGQIWSYGNNSVDGNGTDGAPTRILAFK
jgi:hypothetical protein